MMKEYLKLVLNKTIAKVKVANVLECEYDVLEQVPPVPGQPWEQHDAMVAQGLCNKASHNPRKNRYCNLFPYDKSIVTLQDPEKYINASWVKILPWHPERKFIITMGPMHPSSYSTGMKSDFDEDSASNTCPDFWQMIWDTKSKMIVMLCQVQTGFTGCSEYFPLMEGQTMTHGKFTIKTVKSSGQPLFNVRSFELTHEQETRTVKHLQFKEWPNYGVPDAVGPIAGFIKLVHSMAEALQSKDPELVIHCSGGIGRSGTFLTAYGAYSHFSKLETVGKPEPLSLLPTVKSLRLQRHPWMVEGLHQYQMAYDISIHLLKELSM
jgi:protein tyrosine phosphatase